jgi:predicted aspartyl protease
MSGSSVRGLVLTFSLVAVLPLSLASARNVRPIQLAGYKVVPLHYGPLNKMIMSVSINARPANLIVDTAANQIILDARAAESFGVTPSRHGFRYIGSTQINGQLFPIAFMRSLTAGSMDFGSTPVVLLTSGSNSHSSRLENAGSRVDGVFGADLLVRHKAVINCRTKFAFFKVGESQPLQLAGFASSEKFTKVPLRREQNGGFTVPCSIRGRPMRLLVDTGAFVTTFNEATLTSVGIAMEPTHASARFTTGVARQMSLAQVVDLAIGDFKVPPTKFGAAALPNFALEQGQTKTSGIVGIDLLFMCHAIIDLGSMNLFLK